MRKLMALVAVLMLSACTPAEVGWWTQQLHDADARGERCPQYAPARRLAGLPDGFDYIVWRESRCDPSAVNADSGALGLTQLMPQWLGALCGHGIACSRAELLDAHTNLTAAAYVFGVQGWDAWRCC